MDITYNANKDQANIAKHGVSLSEAASIEWDTLWGFEDARKNYGEQHMIGYAYIGQRLYNVVYVDREGARRIISLLDILPALSLTLASLKAGKDGDYYGAIR